MDPAIFVLVERRGEHAVVTLRRDPVNSLNLAFWQQLASTLDALEADPKVRGVVFQSGLARDLFSAGNDINELYAPKTSQQRYREFWVTQNRFLSRLYASPLVTVAAIRGACPAGGCCLSMCCDYRVMTESGYIGLNEVALGISVPKYWGRLMQRIIGVGPADRLLQFARMPPPLEALQLGLIDEVVPAHKLAVAAEAALERLLGSVPDFSRAETKRLLREEFAQEWAAYAEPEAEGAWAMLSSGPVVQALGATLQRLSGKRRAKL